MTPQFIHESLGVTRRDATLSQCVTKLLEPQGTGDFSTALEQSLLLQLVETQPTKVDFRFHEPEALADFCTSNELG
jgi:hypothetical protein